MLVKLTTLTSVIAARAAALESAVTALNGSASNGSAMNCGSVNGVDDITKQSFAYRDSVIPRMAELRAAADEAEVLTAEDYWPFPTYGDLLFGVK